MKAVVSKIEKLRQGKIIALPSATEEISFLQKISNTGKLVLPTSNGFVCLRYEEIIYLKAQSNYTEIHTIGKRYLFSKTLKSIESLLPRNAFCRVHKSYIINARHVKAFVTVTGDPHLVLENDISIPVSRSHRGQLR